MERNELYANSDGVCVCIPKAGEIWGNRRDERKVRIEVIASRQVNSGECVEIVCFEWLMGRSERSWHDEWYLSDFLRRFYKLVTEVPVRTSSKLGRLD